jgi:hypothetical protein
MGPRGRHAPGRRLRPSGRGRVVEKTRHVAKSGGHVTQFGKRLY